MLSSSDGDICSQLNSSNARSTRVGYTANMQVRAIVKKRDRQRIWGGSVDGGGDEDENDDKEEAAAAGEAESSPSSLMTR
mmetsp:Transcript_25825/g.36067  ORF Transcript_25825/g.36067 Transcript_25825/m.36067 type:complete len:80 (+) Transcript_25825:1045-1284(+)